MNTKKVLIGLAAVFAAGAVAGALYAPDKGERTRRRIGRRLTTGYIDVHNKIEEGRDMLSEIKDEIAEQLEIIEAKMQALNCKTGNNNA